MIKHFKLLLLVLVLMSKRNVHAQCGLYEVALHEKISNSSFIIEGKVIEQNFFKGNSGKNIYTINTIQVFSVFKGNLPSKVFIITAGGVFGNQREVPSSLLSLMPGQTGLFFLNKHQKIFQLSQKDLYDVYASAQGFYQYDLNKRKVAEVFTSYDNDKNQFYKLLASNYALTPLVVYDTLQWAYSNEFERLTVINNFAPTVVNAGTGDDITINGFGFGSSRGNSKVLFKKSDDAGFTEVEAEVPHYKSWSDTKIVVTVPQKAGTGKIAVELNGTRAQSSAILQVKYAIINTGSSALIHPARHVARNTNKGYVWNMNVDFDADTNATSNFLVCFKKWRCKTFINWTIGNNVEVNRSERDTISVITFVDDSELPAGVLAFCNSYYSGCTDDDWYIEEQDLLFRKSEKWHYGNEAIPSNKIDFQSVALHELGHAHQLGHVINNTDLMHYSISNGVQKRDIDDSNYEAAQWILNKSLESDICDKKRMQLLDNDLCNDESFGFYNNVIYPNPFSDNLNIDFYLTEDVTLAVGLYDITGKLIVNYTNNNATKGFFPLVFEVPNHLISSGVYILKMQVGDAKTIKKLIKL
jgi:hypothetical protein